MKKHPQRPKKNPLQPNSREAGPLEVRAAFAPESVNEEARTVDLTWTTGASVKRYDWNSNSLYWEKLRVTTGAVDLTRLNNGAPLLAQHNQYSLNGQIGVVENARIEGGVGKATVRFSKRAEVEPIWQDVRDGIIRNVSVGYSQDEVRKTNEEVDGLPVREVTRWTPSELSLVSVPADAGAQVRTAPEDARAQEDTMDDDETTTETTPATPAAVPAPAPTVNVEAERAAAITQERQRASDIHEAVRQGGQPLELAAELISTGATVEAARVRVLQLVAARNPAIPNTVVQPGDGRHQDQHRAAIVDGLAWAAGNAKPTDAEALRIGSRGLHRAIEDLLEAGGRSCRNMTPAQFARAAMETTDVPNIIAAVAGRSLIRGYESEERTFVGVFRQAEGALNFKNIERVGLSDFPALAAIAEGDPYTEATISAGKETYAVGKYGKRIGYTLEMFLNQDLDALSRLPAMMGAAAARLENDTVWGKVTANGNLADGNAIFRTAADNLTDALLDASALALMRQYFRSRTAPNGQKLNIPVSFLAVGSDLENAAELLLSVLPEMSAAARGDIVAPSLRSRLKLVVEPRLTGDWYGFASPDAIDTFEYSYLKGYEQPTLTREASFDIDKVDMKVRHIIGAGAMGRLGVYKSTNDFEP